MSSAVGSGRGPGRAGFGRWRGPVGLLLVMALGLCLRGRGLLWGLPDLFEEATPLRQALEMWGADTGRIDFDPHFYSYPSLTFYLHFLAQALAAGLGFVTGAWHSFNEFRGALGPDLPRFIALSRWLTAVIAVLTIPPLFRLGRRLGGEGAGWAAALIMALAPLGVDTARAIGTDAPLLCATAFAWLALLDVHERGGRGDYRRAGVWLGLAASCKYPGALLLLPLAWAHFRGARPVGGTRRLDDLVGALLAALAAFALTSPFVLLNLPEALAAIGYERHHMTSGHLGQAGGRAILPYLLEILPRGFGWPLLVVLLVALAWGLRRGGATRLVAGHAALGLALFGSWRVAADRYLLAVVPAWLAVTGAALAAVVAPFLRKPVGEAGAGEAPPGPPAARSAPAAWWAAPALALLLLAPVLPASWRGGELAGRPTTRALATAWLLQNVPRGALVAAESYSVEAAADSLPLLTIPFDAVQPHRYDPAYSLPFYAPFDYVVLSSAQYDRYLGTPERFPAQVRFYEGIARDRDPVALFESGPTSVGPTIRIYRRRPGLRAVDFTGISPEFYTNVAAPGPMAHFLALLGAVLMRAGQNELAAAATEQAVALDPGNPRILMNLGVLETRRGNFVPARRIYERALALLPEDPTLLYNLGQLCQQQGLYDEAIRHYAAALAGNPRLADAYLSLAWCQVRTNRLGPARIILGRFLATLPGDARRGQALAMLKQLETMQ